MYPIFYLPVVQKLDLKGKNDGWFDMAWRDEVDNGGVFSSKMDSKSVTFLYKIWKKNKMACLVSGLKEILKEKKKNVFRFIFGTFFIAFKTQT